MTPAQQKRFYFPIWADSAKRLDWVMAGGRLLADLPTQLRAAAHWPDHARRLVEEIVQLASRRAQAECRAVTADDLRHACNLVASGGKTARSTGLTRRQINQFDRLCAVLRDPWNVSATIAWLHPLEDDRLRTVQWLGRLATEARLRAIAENAFGTREWQALNQSQLDSLAAEVQRHAWATPSQNQRPF